MRYLLLPLALLCMMSSSALAGDDDDQERARQLLESHQVMPLARIAELVSRQYPGRIIDVELEEEDAQVIYEMKILGSDGRVREIHVDAADGRIVANPEHH